MQSYRHYFSTENRTYTPNFSSNSQEIMELTAVVYSLEKRIAELEAKLAKITENKKRKKEKRFQKDKMEFF